MTIRRFGLRSLLIGIAIVAVGIALLKPFEPAIAIHSLKAVPITEPYSHFNGRYRQFRLEVRNTGPLPIWLMSPDSACPDSVGSAYGIANVLVGDFVPTSDRYTKLAPDQVRVYDLVVNSRYESFRLYVDVFDWRGRESHKFLGLHENTGRSTDESFK
ncbi:MAG: hypothetical protein AAGG48_28745 [Planctomycetota bacterium]